MKGEMSELRQDSFAAESHATNLLLLTWSAGMLDGLVMLARTYLPRT